MSLSGFLRALVFVRGCLSSTGRRLPVRLFCSLEKKQDRKENMKFSLPLLAAVAEAAVIGGRADIPPPGDDGRYTISSDGIKAQVCVGEVE